MTTDTVPPPAKTPEPAPAPKKGGALKWVLYIGCALVVLFVLFIGGLYLFRNTLVKMGVERAGKYATDQETTLDAADLEFGDGSLQLNTLGMGNPTPYKEAHFLVMKSCKVGVDSGSLLTSNVHVKEIVIEGLEIYLEQDGLKTNLGDILDFINKQTGSGGAAAGGGTAPAGDTPPGKSLTIDVIKLTGTKVHVRGMMKLDLDLGPVEIADPTNPDGRPMKLANVVGTVLIHVAVQLAENPALPDAFKHSLKDVDKILKNVSKGMPKGLGKDLQNLTSQPGKAVEDLEKGIKLPFGGK